MGAPSRIASLASSALLIAAFLFLFGCAMPKNGNLPSMNLSNFSAANLTNFIIGEGGAGQAGEANGSGGIATEPAETRAADELNASICDDMLDHALNMPGRYIAVPIPANLESDAESLGYNMTFTSPGAFVAPVDFAGRPIAAPINYSIENYYWNCWANGGPDTHICIIPVAIQKDFGNGTAAAYTGAIKLTFEGGLEPLRSACNWTWPVDNETGTAQNVHGPQPQSPSSGAPVMAGQIITPPDTPECASPPSNGMGGESGPHDVYPWMMHLWLPINERLPSHSTAPGPMANTPTFNRTGCELDIDQPCPPVSGAVLCGQCSFASSMDVITSDQSHPSPGKYVGNLGQCRYCPDGTTCSESGGYSICGDLACSGPRPPPSSEPFSIGCSSCPDGGTVSRNYPDRSYQSWAECINTYNYCHGTLNCGRILDNCRSQQPS